MEAQPEVLLAWRHAQGLCSLPTHAWPPAAGNVASQAFLPKLPVPLVITSLNTWGSMEARVPSSKGVLGPTQHHPGRACWEFLERLISHCQRAFPRYLVDTTCSYISSIMPLQTQLINSSLLPTTTLFNAGPLFCLTPVSMLQRQPGNKVFIPYPIPALDT